VSPVIDGFGCTASIPFSCTFNVTLTSHGGAAGASFDPANFRLNYGGVIHSAVSDPVGSPNRCTPSRVVPPNGSSTCEVAFRDITPTAPGGVIQYRNPSPPYSATASFSFAL
jgi:hypothetical protein